MFIQSPYRHARRSIRLLLAAAPTLLAITGSAPASDAPPTSHTGGSAPNDIAARVAAAEKLRNPFKRQTELLHLVGSVPLAEIPSVVVANPSGRPSFTFVSLLLGRWVAEDPKAAIDWLLTRSPTKFRASFAQALFTAWAAIDPPAATAAAEQITDPAIKEVVARAVTTAANNAELGKAFDGAGQQPTTPDAFAKIAARDPAAAANWLKTIQPGQQRIEAARLIAAAYVGKSNASAFKWAAMLAEPEERDAAMDEVLAGLPPDFLARNALLFKPISEFAPLGSSFAGFALMRWAKSDFQAATQWITSQTECATKPRIVDAIALAWARSEPEAAVVFAEKNLPVGQERDCTMSKVAAQWAQSAPTAALKWGTSLPDGGFKNEICVSVMSAWAQSDPQAAAAHLSELADKELRKRATTEVATAWIKVDPQKAIDLVQSIPESEYRDRAMSDAITALSYADLDAAAALVHTMPPSETKHGAIWLLSSKMVGTDIDAAIRWAEAFSDPGDRTCAVANTVDAWSGGNPTAAAAYVAALKPGIVQNESIGRVARNWVCNDPPAAAAWASQLAESEGRQFAFRTIAESWAHFDEGAAGQWLNDLPDSRSRDAAVAAYADSLVEDDPEAAFRWCETIQAPGERQARLWSVASRWIEKNRPAAEAAIRASNLPDMQKEALLHPE